MSGQRQFFCVLAMNVNGKFIV